MKELISVEKIPDYVKAVIFDFWGTIVYNEQYKISPGFDKLVKHLFEGDVKMAISSDGFSIPDHMKIAEVKNSFKFDPYFNGNVFYGPVHMDLKINNGFGVKNLDEILRKLEVNADQTVFVGDNCFRRDEQSSRIYGVPFLLVKQGQVMDGLYQKKK